MSIYNEKTILVVGGLNLIDVSFITRLIEAGAKEVRVLDGTETAVQTLRETCNLEPETKKHVLFYVGDLTDNAYMEEAMSRAALCAVCPCHSPCLRL